MEDFVDSFRHQRRRLSLLISICVLLGASDSILRASNGDLAHEDKSAGDQPTALHKEREGKIQEERKIRTEQAKSGGSERAATPQQLPIAPPRAQASESTSSSWNLVFVFAGIAVILALLERPRRPRPLRDLMIRVASFGCPECDRPITQMGALNASLLRIPRGSPKWGEIDKDKLTPRQLVGPEAI